MKYNSLKDHVIYMLQSCYGVDFNEDFHRQPSSVIEELTEYAKECKYKKPKNANGSTARYFYEHLAKHKQKFN